MSPSSKDRIFTVSRRNFMRGALGAATVAAGATSLPASRASALTPYVTNVKTLIGTQTWPQFGIGATDLGIPARCPNGRTLYVFGDTFSGTTVGSGDWRSPVALWSDTSDVASGVTFNGAVGGSYASQLWYYPHDSYYQTVIPSDVITIGNTMYLHAIVNGPTFGTVRWTEVWKSTDSGASWQHTGLKFPGDKDGGLFQLITWAQGSDGYVYLYATGFQRDKGIILYRVPENRLADGSAYQPWGWNGTQWGWGNPATIVADGKWGEMCLRPLNGAWLLTWFNAGEYRIDAMILNSPLDNLFTARKTTLIRGTTWGNEGDTRVAQLYGGYIIPGSTLWDFHLTVSQWNTTTNDVYHVMQFRVRNLV
jgi:hypothetical protein